MALSQSHGACATDDERGLINVLVALSHLFFIEELIWAASLSPHPSVANYLTVELSVLQAMAQELAQLFDLTLPFSLRM